MLADPASGPVVDPERVILVRMSRFEHDLQLRLARDFEVTYGVDGLRQARTEQDPIFRILARSLWPRQTAVVGVVLAADEGGDAAQQRLVDDVLELVEELDLPVDLPTLEARLGPPDVDRVEVGNLVAGEQLADPQRHAPCQDAAGLLSWDGPEGIPLPPGRADARKAPPQSTARQRPPSSITTRATSAQWQPPRRNELPRKARVSAKEAVKEKAAAKLSFEPRRGSPKLNPRMQNVARVMEIDDRD